MNCISKFSDRMECKNCGWKHSSASIQKNCRVKKEQIFLEEPSLRQKMSNFSSAFIEDVKTGMKRCTQSEIDERLAICRECPFFLASKDGSRGTCTHKLCGCNIRAAKVYWNKLAWKSQSCPINKW